MIRRLLAALVALPLLCTVGCRSESRTVTPSPIFSCHIAADYYGHSVVGQLRCDGAQLTLQLTRPPALAGLAATLLEDGEHIALELYGLRERLALDALQPTALLRRLLPALRRAVLTGEPSEAQLQYDEQHRLCALRLPSLHARLYDYSA